MAKARGRGRQRATTTKAGLAPGTAVYTGHAADFPVRATVFDYDAEHVNEHADLNVAALAAFRESGTVSWIDVVGLHDVAIIQAVGEVFGLHALVVEDVLSTGSLPKAEDYEGAIFVQLKMLEVEESDGSFCVAEDHVSFLLGPSWVLTFQERPGDLWDPVRKRIRAGTGRIRKLGPDYLLHALLDAVVDGYFAVLARIEERVDQVEVAAMDLSGPSVLHEVHALRTELLALRRTVHPLRVGLSELAREGNQQITPAVRPYFRDLLDHVTRAAEGVETCRDRLAGVLDIHLATTSQRTNEVMRVLTLVSTVFIPLTFIVGVYGMNFKHMPELEWTWGYPGVLALMACLAVGMLGWMRARSWV